MKSLYAALVLTSCLLIALACGAASVGLFDVALLYGALATSAALFAHAARQRLA